MMFAARWDGKMAPMPDEVRVRFDRSELAFSHTYDASVGTLRSAFPSNVTGYILNLWRSPEGVTRYAYSIGPIGVLSDPRKWHELTSQAWATNESLQADREEILAWLDGVMPDEEPGSVSCFHHRCTACGYVASKAREPGEGAPTFVGQCPSCARILTMVAAGQWKGVPNW